MYNGGGPPELLVELGGGETGTSSPANATCRAPEAPDDAWLFEVPAADGEGDNVAVAAMSSLTFDLANSGKSAGGEDGEAGEFDDTLVKNS